MVFAMWTASSDGSIVANLEGDDFTQERVVVAALNIAGGEAA